MKQNGWHAPFKAEANYMRALTAPLLILLLTLSSVVTPALAETNAASDQSSIPINFLWIASAWPSWDAAMTEMKGMDGGSAVMFLPTTSTEYPWLILRRHVGGSFHIPDDAPFTVETYEDVSVALARFSAFAPDHKAILVTTADGHTLVVSLNGPKRRRSVTRLP